MRADPATSEWSSERGGTTYRFRSPACKDAFDSDPGAANDAAGPSGDAL